MTTDNPNLKTIEWVLPDGRHITSDNEWDWTDPSLRDETMYLGQDRTPYRLVNHHIVIELEVDDRVDP